MTVSPGLFTALVFGLGFAAGAIGMLFWLHHVTKRAAK